MIKVQMVKGSLHWALKMNSLRPVLSYTTATNYWYVAYLN